MSINKLFDNRDRPLIITIVGWWLIIIAIITAYSLISINFFDVSHIWGYTEKGAVWIIIFNIITNIVYLAAGYGILNGQNWGRTLYFIYTPVSILVSAIAFQIELSIITIGLLFFLLFTYLLTRKASNDFFNGNYVRSPKDLEDRRIIKKLRRDQQRKSNIARLFGLVFTIGSGFLIFFAVIFIAFSPEFDLFIFLILSSPIILSLIVSCGLWGWKRWFAITGWTFLSAGGVTVFMGLTVAILSQTTVWQQTVADLGNELDNSTFQIMWQIGLIPTTLGLALLFLQYNRDIDLSSEITMD